MIVRKRLAVSPDQRRTFCSTKALTLDDSRRWPFPSCLDPWSHVVQLPGPRPVAFQHGFKCPPPCIAAIYRPCPFLMYRHPRNPSLRLTDRSLLCEKTSSLHRFSSTLRQGNRAPSPRDSILTKVERMSLPPGDHGTSRIPSIRSASPLSDSRVVLTIATRAVTADT